MSRLEHTPGPWIMDTKLRTSIDSGEKHIAMVNCYKGASGYMRQEEHDANARLIAAAPDMLEVLVEFCRSNCGDQFCTVYKCGGCFLLPAKAAVEKATGKKIEEVLG